MATYTLFPAGSLASVSQFTQLALIVTTGGSEHIDTTLDRPRAGVWTLYKDTDLKVNPWRLNGSGVWVVGSDTTLVSAAAVGAIIRYGSTLLVAYALSGTASLGAYRLKGGSLIGVQTIGSGTTLGDMILDSQNRLVTTIWNGAWKVQVGTHNAAGSSPEWTFSAQVDMGLSAVEKGGSLLLMPGGEILFSFVNSSNVVQLVTAKKLAKDGSGVWS